MAIKITKLQKPTLTSLQTEYCRDKESFFRFNQSSLKLHLILGKCQGLTPQFEAVTKVYNITLIRLVLEAGARSEAGDMGEVPESGPEPILHEEADQVMVTVPLSTCGHTYIM